MKTREVCAPRKSAAATVNSTSTPFRTINPRYFEFLFWHNADLSIAPRAAKCSGGIPVDMPSLLL
jgi:hypothetical protein